MSSYGRSTTLTCPAGHQFQAISWRLIDFGTNPELLESLRDGLLFRPACASCGRRDLSFAEPLLLFFPNRRRPLVFTLYSGLEESDLQQTVDVYVSHLRQSIGDQWREEWSAGAIPVILRSNLPKFLDSYLRNDEPLEQIMFEAVGAQKLYQQTQDPGLLNQALEAFDRLLSHTGLPDLSTDTQFSIYGTLAELLRHRYRIEGREDDLTRALEVLGIARRFSADLTEIDEIHGRLLLDRYSHSSHFADVAEAAIRLEISIAMSTGRADYISANMAGAQAWRQIFNDTNLPLAIDRSILLLRDAVKNAASDANRDEARNRLGDGLDKRHQRFRNTTDAEEAISLFTQVIESSQNEEQLQLAYNGRGCVQLDRFTQNHSVEDLRAAVPDLQRALQREPTRPSDHATYLIDLGNGLRAVYEVDGDPRNLEAAIDSQRKSVAVSRANRLDPNVALYNLCILLHARYAANGGLSDLNDAIDCLNVVNELTMKGSQHEAAFRMTLGILLCERYQLASDSGDLDRALGFLRTVPDAEILAENLKPAAAQALGTALILKFRQANNPEHLDAAISSLYETCLASNPAASTLSSAHSEYAVALTERYKLSYRPADLEEAIASARRACALIPAHSPHRPATLFGLAQCLENRALAEEDDGTRQEVLLLCKEVANQEIDARTALRSAAMWADLEFESGNWTSAAEAFERLFAARSELLATQARRSDKEIWLRAVQGTAADAAYAFAKIGAIEKAAEALESGAAILVSETLGTFDLDEARLRSAGFASLADEYERVAARWRALVQAPAPIPGAVDRSLASQPIAEVRQALNNVLAQIRAVPQFEKFRTFASIKNIQQSSQDYGGPLVYLAATSHGALAVLVCANSVHELWLPLAKQRLARLLVREAEDGTFTGYQVAQFGPPDVIDVTLAEVLPLLEEQLIGTLRGKLKAIGAERVALIPTALLAQLPIAAALSTDFPVAVQINARSLEQAIHRGRKESEGLPLIVGNPLPNPAPLPASEFEARLVATHLPASIVLVGAAVDKESVIHALRVASYVHFACHGAANLGDALSSAIFLGGDERITVRDLLFGGASLQNARMVVLSACQSAIPDAMHLPDEAVGLPAAFLEAGVPTVVGTLWPIDDWSTALLMDRFYFQFLQKRQIPAVALREAQLWLRTATAAQITDYFQRERQKSSAELKAPYRFISAAWRRFAAMDPHSTPFASPLYWAPFVCYGV